MLAKNSKALTKNNKACFNSFGKDLAILAFI